MNENLPLNPFDNQENNAVDYHEVAEQEVIAFDEKRIKGLGIYRWGILFFILRFLRKVIFSGGQSVVTIFEYKNEKHVFQTRIQMDADIINFVPDPEKYGKDKEWYKLYEEKTTLHFQTLQDFFVKLYASTRLWGIIIFVPILFLFNEDFFEELYEMLSDEDGDGKSFDTEDFGNNGKDNGKELEIFKNPYLRPYKPLYDKYDFYIQLFILLFTIYVRPWLTSQATKVLVWVGKKVWALVSWLKVHVFHKRKKAAKA